jgi:ribonuclease P protein component
MTTVLVRRAGPAATGEGGRAVETGSARLGLTASRRTGNAVERNRLRRTIREAFRRYAAAWPGIDIVVIFREGATAKATPRLLRAEFRTSVERALSRTASFDRRRPDRRSGGGPRD